LISRFISSPPFKNYGTPTLIHPLIYDGWA
jgi:hypothetical protein